MSRVILYPSCDDVPSFRVEPDNLVYSSRSFKLKHKGRDDRILAMGSLHGILNIERFHARRFYRFYREIYFSRLTNTKISGVNEETLSMQ